MAGSAVGGYPGNMHRGLASLAGVVLLLAAPAAAGRPDVRHRGAGPARNPASSPAQHVAAKGRRGKPPRPGGAAPHAVSGARAPAVAHAGAAGASPPVPRRTGKTSRSRKPPAPAKPAASIGSPTDGHLEGGVELHAGPGVALKHATGPHWGLPRLVSLIERAAHKVDKRFDGSVMLVGDLSRPAGGTLGGHRSHESGRDADVGFYYVDAAGHPVETRRFHHVRWDGRAGDALSLRFDDARNWELVKAWVTDPHARVQHIFIAAPLRTRLLVYARAHGTYLPVLQRASIAMKQPRHALPHDDHFHVRIACPGSQRDVCVSEPARRAATRGKKRATKRVRRRH